MMMMEKFKGNLDEIEDQKHRALKCGGLICLKWCDRPKVRQLMWLKITQE